MIKAILKFRGQLVREYQLNQPNVIIGRDGDVDIKIENQGVLGKHCKLTKKVNRYLLEDLGTPAGLELNGEKIRMAHIKNGDALSLGGHFTLEFELAGASASGALPKQAAPLPTGGGLSIDGQPVSSPIANAGKSEDFFTNATMVTPALSNFDIEQLEKANETQDLNLDDLEIEPLALDDLNDPPENEGVSRVEMMEKINSMLMIIDDDELNKVCGILEILYG